ncbi:MAG: outer membrane lipid asymmetry maintenance protein MlaD [Deltaproteobacteria bacterium HGW-Deltaproteobacteria-18]|jgi:phospholipid/cholesterol/gamma-HCH transport system substrate-binding protein|nr:MAG: outer membrane lipid asymmetry maintenance protein MlaD [Deltaproteobacteria bacterium HGW-Deltaproteobacteria-18]
MKTNNSSLHLSIGLFVIVGLACTAYLAMTLANTTFFAGDSYEVTAKFTAVNGLRAGSNVEISGVAVGKVSSISLDQTLYQAVITMNIDNSVGIPVDSTAAIKTSGLIGDKYVSIIPGADDVLLKNKEILMDTQAALDIEEMISKYVFGSVDK